MVGSEVRFKKAWKKKKKKMVGSEVRFKKAWKKIEEENGWEWGEI